MWNNKLCDHLENGFTDSCLQIPNQDHIETLSIITLLVMSKLPTSIVQILCF